MSNLLKYFEQLLKDAESISYNETIAKVDGKYKIFSKHLDKDGKRKVLGVFNTEPEAKKRLRQIEYFKHLK